MSSPVNTSPFAHVVETAAWYWLWCGVVCLMLVPAAWSWSAAMGFVPYWLIGAPLTLLAGLRALAYARAPSAGTRIAIARRANGALLSR